MDGLSTRNAPGQIRDAIVEYLSDRGRDADVSEIHSHAEARCGGMLPASSVRSYLLNNTPGIFRRTARGRYELADKPLVTMPLAFPTPPSSEVFSFGKSTLYQGDALEWLADRPPNTLHAVVTDPPYGLVEYTKTEQAKMRAGRGGVWRFPPAIGGHERAPLPRFTTLDAADLTRLAAFFRTFAARLLPSLVPGAHVCIASNPLVSYLVASAIVGAGFERRGEVIRLVMTLRGGDRPKNAHDEFPDVSVMPRSMWEPWLLFRKPLDGRVQDNLRRWKTGGLRRRSAGQPFFDVIDSAPTQKAERAIANHPSLKPQRFLRQIVRAMLPLGIGTVADPFAGSGSTLAAAEAVGYASVGVEVDPAYVAVAKGAIPKLAALRVRPEAGADTASLF